MAANVLRKPTVCFTRLTVFYVALCFALSWISGCGQKKPAGPAFDVPSLIGLKISAVTARLGPGQELPAASQGSGRRQWRKDGYVLRADFRQRNERVTEWRVSLDDPQKTIRDKDKDELLSMARLQQGDARYNVEWEEDPNQVERYRSLQVVPTPRQHRVTLRVTGQNLGEMTLVQFALQVAGNIGENPSENGLTLAPWQRELQAQDGTQLKLEAVPNYSRTPLASGASITVQIEVNGKVVSQQTASAGGAASCDWEI
jgi:hypothetical protein